MTLKHIIMTFVIALIFAACGKENKIGEPTVLPLDVHPFPQGLAPASVDQRILDFFHTYNTYLVYDYTMEAAAWRLVGSPVALTAYSFPPSDPAKVGGQLDLLQELFLDFYPDEFLKENLPYKIFLADQMLFRTNATLPWNEWGSFSSGNVFVFGLGRVEHKLPADSMYIMFNFVNRDILTFMNNNAKLILPSAAFFAQTNYTVSVTATFTQYAFPEESRFRSINSPNDVHLEAGLFANINPAQALATIQTNDVISYLTYMRYFPKNSPQWERYLSFPRVKAKYDILVEHWMETYGYNPHDLANADFGEIIL